VRETHSSNKWRYWIVT